MSRLFPKSLQVAQRAKLENLTLRGFSGGLNTTDSDLAMDPRFCVVAKNFRRTSDKSMKVRYGNSWFADVADTVSGNILDMKYFSNAIIAPTVDGEIVAVTDMGAKTAIWNSAIAAALLGAPSGWSTGLTQVNFVPFKSALIIHNGIDKPVSINSSLITSYLADAATGSNVNVPIGKYGCVVSNYHCVAGIPSAPTSIFISSKGTSGTFIGDPAPNDSISIDVGAYAPEGAPEIRGIAGYRNSLLVFFAGSTLPITLGVYDAGSVHTPQFPDALPQFGLLGHRCIVQVDNDILFSGLRGVATAKKNLYLVNQIDSQPISDIIEPSYRRAIGMLTDTQLQKNTFMLYDNSLHDTTLYAPDGSAVVFSANERLRYKSWSTYQGTAWTCGCLSFLGRMFFARDTRIYKSGNKLFTGEGFAADRIDDRDDEWQSGTTYFVNDIIRDTGTNESYKCIVQHVSGGVSFTQDRADQVLSPKWELFEGVPIDIELELAWLDGRDPMKVKVLRFVNVASKGTAQFSFRVWVDNLYKDADGNVVFNPAITLAFIGNDAPGFGFDAGPYGGGRRSGDPRLFGFPVKFKTLKPGIIGSVTEPLEITNISFLYTRGQYNRV